jgi:hypothetical protein
VDPMGTFSIETVHPSTEFSGFGSARSLMG